jgi:RNA-directed DNA polymerase
MGSEHGSQFQQGTFNWGAEVKPQGPGARAELPVAKPLAETPMFGETVMEVICERSNLQAALRQVRANRGSPGVDGMTVDVLPDFLREQWPTIKDRLLKGEYEPQPVRRVEIPKPGSTEPRTLGIPCVLDRLIQQAVLQVLQPRWDATFSESSYGFRPGRSAHQAVAQAQAYLQQGYAYVVDIDLEKFFDHVCHDRLMSQLARRIADKRVLKLIRAYLRAGILENGLVTVPTEGTPQGGPLSPFLSNCVLDELDKEVERRGHRFVRYADDSNIYVKSERAGRRVMESVSHFITQRLKLRVNATKSAVDKPQHRTFLGFSFTSGKNPARRKLAPKAVARFKAKVRELTRRTRGISLQERIHRLARYLNGWRQYYGYCETPSVLQDLDSWIRRRLRAVQWKQWKRYKRRKAELLRLGVPEALALTTAWSAKGPWRMCHTTGVQLALPASYFDALGLPRLAAQPNMQLNRTAVVRTRMPGGVGGGKS